MKTMKALVKKHRKPGLWLEEVPVPNPGVTDVLIKIRKTSICGTDVHIYDWDEWARRAIPVPMIIGHEFVGEVAGFGAGVTGINIGDLVSGEGHLVCMTCRNCLGGRLHMCPNTVGIGVNRDGAFAEYLSMPASNIWRCDPAIPEELFPCFDPYGNAVHTALMYNTAGEDVLVTGAGPIGIMAAAVCMHTGARNVAITDLNPYRLDLARKMGIKHAFDPREVSIKEIMLKLGVKEGFDIGLEMSGSPHAFNDLVNHMANGGKIAMLGMQAKGTSIDWDRVVFGMLTIKGVYGREMYETWYKMTAFLRSGLDISKVITHRLPAERFEEGFAAMKSGNSGKVILDWV